VTALERVRISFHLSVYAYVVMPEHVHLLLGEPERKLLSDALKSLKQGVSRRLCGEADHFWEKRYYDYNVRNRQQFAQKLDYIHHNPVKRGLCERPEDFQWSSCCHYATGMAGRVEIESEWTARRRELAAEIAHSSQKKA
jgi:putative transposase